MTLKSYPQIPPSPSEKPLAKYTRFWKHKLASCIMLWKHKAQENGNVLVS